MYCIKCGVALADSEASCPLCGTRVYHPDLPTPKGEKPYPSTPKPEERVNPLGLMVVLTVLFALPAILTLLIDLRVNRTLDWSGYVIGGLLVFYVSFVLPFWFKKPNPVIFLPCSLASIALLLFYVNFNTGGKWFWSFALPLVGSLAITLTAVVTLVRYVRKGYLYIFGGALLLSGAEVVVLEFLINLTFHVTHFAFWSLYPLIVCFILGMLLIVTAICRPIRESLYKVFFL